MGSSVRVVLAISVPFSHLQTLQPTFGSACTSAWRGARQRNTHNPRLAAVSQHHLELVLRSQLLELLLDVLDDKVGDALDGQVGDQSDRELSLDRSRDDSLGSRSGYVSERYRRYHRHERLTESALDTVQRQTGVS